MVRPAAPRRSRSLRRDGDDERGRACRDDDLGAPHAAVEEELPDRVGHGRGLRVVEPDERAKYESAERQREAKLGPRCRVTSSAAAALLKVGDKLQVTYLLGNEYRIDIVRVEIFQELPGRDVNGGATVGPR